MTKREDGHPSSPFEVQYDKQSGRKWEPAVHKVIEYKSRSDEYRKRASQTTNPQEREAEERMAAAWELLARTREKQLKEGNIQSAFSSAQINRRDNCMIA